GRARVAARTSTVYVLAIVEALLLARCRNPPDPAAAHIRVQRRGLHAEHLQCLGASDVLRGGSVAGCSAHPREFMQSARADKGFYIDFIIEIDRLCRPSYDVSIDIRGRRRLWTPIGGSRPTH